MYYKDDSIVSKIYASGVIDELLKNMGVKENDFDDLKQELAIITPRLENMKECL